MTESLFTPEEQLTIATYDQIAEEWTGKHATAGFWESELAIFKKNLPSGRILEVGCGGGRDAKDLIAAGFNYTGVDVSEGLVKVARQNLRDREFFVQSVYELDFPENNFDGFWSSATLLHIPQQKLPLALGKIHRVTKPAGVGFISVKEGEGERILTEELNGKEIQRFFAFHSQKEFSSTLGDNGFSVLEVVRRPMSEKTTWLSFFVKVIK